MVRRPARAVPTPARFEAGYELHIYLPYDDDRLTRHGFFKDNQVMQHTDAQWRPLGGDWRMAVYEITDKATYDAFAAILW